MTRAAIAREIAALASQDNVLFHALWEATAQYIDNQGVEFDDVEPEIVARVDAVETTMVAFDTVMASLAD